MQVVEDSKNGVFEGQKRVRIYFDRDEDKVNGPSRNRVKPEFYKESRIDNIMKKAMKSGMISIKPNSRFGDFTSGQDFLQLQNRMIQLQQYFDDLPSDTRNFFANNPKNYLDFVMDPRHRAQAIEMGLIEKPQAAPAPDAPPVPPAVPPVPAVPPPAA